jgi:hypothetical protein
MFQEKSPITSCCGQREILDAQELSYPGEPGPGPCGRTLRLGLDHVHDAPAEL